MAMEDKEIWVGENRFYLDENNLLLVTIVGEHDDQIAKEMQIEFLKLLEMVDGKVKIYADNTRSGKASPEARKMFSSLTEHKKVGKVAVFGANPVARVIATFVMGLSKNKDIGFFSSKEKAMAWLKE
jgi:hypothetical protein